MKLSRGFICFTLVLVIIVLVTSCIKPKESLGAVKVLFDNAHSETAGNADWTIRGGFSSFADDLKKRGCIVSEWGNDEENKILDDDAPITLDELKKYDIYIIPEPNIPFKKEEQEAIINYINYGGNVFFIADHIDSDRNNDGWDSPQIFNGFKKRSRKIDTSEVYPEDFVGKLGFRFNELKFTEDPITNIKNHEITRDVLKTGTWAGTTEYIMDKNLIQGVVYLNDEVKGPYIIAGTYGRGKFVALGDSSPIDDGTGKAGNKLYDGYGTYDDAKLSCNIIEWLSK